MTTKEQIYYLLEHYHNGNYATDTFVDEFYRIYSIEMDYDLLVDRERELLAELAEFTELYSPFEEDFETYPFRNEKEVKQKATEIYLKLIETTA